MRPVYLTHCDIATALGEGVARNWERLLHGDSGVGPIERFDTSALAFRQAACLPGLQPQDGSNRTCALMQSCLADLPPLPADTPLIWAGCKGAAEAIECEDNERAGDMPYRADDFRLWVARQLNLDGAGLSVNAACASSTVALALAAGWIASGRHDRVLVCAADIVSRFAHTGFAALRALSPTAARPFDCHRDGLVLGDGAATILVSAREGFDGLRPQARLAGWGISNDATHITAPARDGNGLQAAISRALEVAGLAPDAVAAFCAHGTGTVFNDAMELSAIEALFGERRFPLFSVKGAIGHTLGAAGAIEAALCAEVMRERVAPPTAGLLEPEPRAEGRVSPRSQPLAEGAILTTNSGFGGINAALILAPVAREDGA